MSSQIQNNEEENVVRSLFVAGEKSSIVFKVFKATLEYPLKNDFVETCKKYMKILNIDLTFEQLGKKLLRLLSVIS